ncbi:uracil DNA N-glycosylase Thp1 [Sorochytrium milnesiophthora]
MNTGCPTGTLTFRERIQQFSYAAGEPLSPPQASRRVAASVKSKKRKTLSTPETEAEELREVDDCVAADLDILFVGINPGIESSKKGCHFAGPTNCFWPHLHASGLLDKALTAADDAVLPEKHRMGIINYVARPTRSSADLTTAEYNAARPKLTERLQELRPRIVCFVGKGIYENWTRSKCATLGVQQDWEMRPGHCVKMFCMPSTSARTSTYQQKDKLQYFVQLKELLDSVLTTLTVT